MSRSENFDHELVVEDPQRVLYSLIVNRRERYNSFGRMFRQNVSFVCLIAAVWLYFISRDPWWLLGGLVFTFATIVNAQVLNYRVILEHLGRKEEEDEVDDIS